MIVVSVCIFALASIDTRLAFNSSYKISWNRFLFGFCQAFYEVKNCRVLHAKWYAKPKTNFPSSSNLPHRFRSSIEPFFAAQRKRMHRSKLLRKCAPVLIAALALFESIISHNIGFYAIESQIVFLWKPLKSNVAKEKEENQIWVWASYANGMQKQIWDNGKKIKESNASQKIMG